MSSSDCIQKDRRLLHLYIKYSYVVMCFIIADFINNRSRKKKQKTKNNKINKYENINRIQKELIFNNRFKILCFTVKGVFLGEWITVSLVQITQMC